MKRLLIIASGIASLIFFLPPLRCYFVANWTLRPFYLLAFSASMAFFLTPVVIRLAKTFKALDTPSTRKVHSNPTPLWGGLGIFAAFAVVTIYNFDFSLAQKGVSIGGAMLVGIGLLDDRFSVSAKIRLLVQLAAASVAIWAGARMSFLPNTWWGNGLEIVLSYLWFIGLANAMNFLDGMDGLCAGLSAINSFFFGIVAFRTGQPFFMFLSAALCGACLGFLPYNFRKGKPALIFLGDTGSTYLGFTLAGIALTGDWAADNYVAVIVPIIILAIPIFDMTMTTVIRIRLGQVKSISEWLHFTGKDHFHHRLADMGFGKRQTVQVIHLVAICLGINGFILRHATLLDAGLLLGETIIIFAFMGFVLVFVKNQYQYMAKLLTEQYEFMTDMFIKKDDEEESGR